MNPVRKVHPTKRHRQNKRWITFFSALLLIVMIGAVAYFWYPTNNKSAINEPEGFKTLTAHYLAVMKNLNLSETKASIASQLDPSSN